ncbi:class I SAM-dependent methyltransferase [Solicola gregarius]|uniref:Class I SAM-dependent methyltransferase n=1 Tax=Solicola gregarius TaxID=2908642 RepID=A0AA46TFW3_9ACTN|nr:class I SAM-dependent methyltransferase [Solicola gregarius]UYM04114.1 class I SAM-dependent methyltransferase [Solicola gregarius]
MPAMSRPERSFCRSGVWQKVARRLVPWTTLGATFHGDVLEIGGGGGGMAEALARTNPDVRLMMTDVDPAMVDVARVRLARYSNVAVRQADVTRMPFADATYDAVVSFLMLHHVIAWEAAVDEVARVLRPGGMFVGYDLTDTPVSAWTHRIDGSPHRLIPRGAFEPAVENAGLDIEQVRYSGRNHVVRFRARKPR